MNSDVLAKARAYEEQYSPQISEEQRPLFHLTPYVGWMNDPNGFSFYQGQFHLFYQYHPYQLQWGPMHWGHAVSKDLIHWSYLPCALAPDQGYDGFGCFSGSAVELPDGRQLLMYTGVYQEKQADGTNRDIQTQCLAVGDGYNYEKYAHNPVLDESTLPPWGNRYDFRDPKLWANPDGSYGCVVSTRTDDGSGALLIYKSQDGFHWEFDDVLDRCCNEYGKMWECPDYFPLDGTQVILTSPQDMRAKGLEYHCGNGTIYIIGEFCNQTNRFERNTVCALDYGLDFYAPQTTLAPDGRRIMVAWMQNWDTCMVPPGHTGWFGQMTIPRELSIRDGKLIQVPVRELESMRRDKVSYCQHVCGALTLPEVRGRCVDLNVTVTLEEGQKYKEFTLKVACDDKYATYIRYYPETSVLQFDRSESGLCRDIVHQRSCRVPQKYGSLQLRVILDRYSVEVFANGGKQVMTSVIYTPEYADGITFQIDGTATLTIEHYTLTR